MNKKKLIKNCATCWWSHRDCETLTLYCNILPNHPMKIKNTHEDSKICNSYTFEKPQNTQLNLFT